MRTSELHPHFVIVYLDQNMGSNYFTADHHVSLLLNTNASYPCMIFLVACKNHNAVFIGLAYQGKDMFCVLDSL
jgi:hypothetical protein